MENTEATAALTAFGVLASQLLDAGVLDREALIKQLQLSASDLQDAGLDVAANALGNFAEGAGAAWRMAATLDHTQN